MTLQHGLRSSEGSSCDQLFFARKDSPRADLESGHRGYGTSGLLGVDVRVRTKVWKGEGYHINFMFGGKTQVSHSLYLGLEPKTQNEKVFSPCYQITAGRSTCRGPAFERIREGWIHAFPGLEAWLEKAPGLKVPSLGHTLTRESPVNVQLRVEVSGAAVVHI